MIKTFVPIANFCGAYEESNTAATLTTSYHYGSGGDSAMVCYGLDSYNQSIEEECAQTIRTPCGGDSSAKVIQALDMTHANDVIRVYDDGTVPTLQHRMGTGGNQVPLVLSINENQQADVRLSEKSYCVQAGGGKPGQGYQAVLIRCAGFVGAQGAKAKGIAWEENKAPTLRGGILSDVCIEVEHGK